ncbi:MAG: hypothetical protein Q7R47_06585, partial [Candidatus Diapherotrites archaeon]|nr:hypothetical protein [Candidatus Diapherotrites archaeon]
GISVEEYRKPVLAARVDNAGLHTETRFVKLTNDASLVQADALNPLYGVLEIAGIRHIYNKDQVYEKNEPTGLRQNAPEKIASRFHLQFNSYKPSFDVEVSPEIGNCQIGTTIGSTGAQAVPRTKLDWRWSAIDADSCDTDNANYIYCDAAQFSMALLKKMQVLEQFTQANAALLECPSLVGASTAAEQSLSSTGLDYGVTRLEIARTGSDANVVTTIENMNNVPANMQLTTVVTNITDGTVVKTCPQIPVSVLSKTTSGCMVSGLLPGEYKVKASLSNASCANCENAVLFDDTLETNLQWGLEGLAVECEPVSTTRLAEFIGATEKAGKTLVYPPGYNREKIIKLSSFRAHLMADGYSNSFRKDFDEYARTQAFLQTPTYYSGADGLGEYFVDPAAMAFEYLGSPNNPVPGPGIYSVTLDVNFSDRKMQWFSNSSPAAHITVLLDKTGDASPASPFYYYPLDGEIGRQKGRIGYGT